jgi:serine/threonine protein kinase
MNPVMSKAAHHHHCCCFCLGVLLCSFVSAFQASLPSTNTPTRDQTFPELFVYHKQHGDDDDTAKWIVSHDELDHDYHLLDDPQHRGRHNKNLHEAIRRCEDTGNTYGEPVMVKTSKNFAAMQREIDNTILVQEQVEEDVVVDIVDHNLSQKNDDDKHGVIVMEKGAQDSLSYLNRHYDAQTWAGVNSNDKANLGNVSVASKMVYGITNSIKAIHSAGLVWTDAKLKNFVVMEDNRKAASPNVKAIDLESCTRPGNHPIKFTPSTCPPEFVPVLRAHIKGRSKVPFHPTHPSFDVWSLGMIAFLLVTKTAYFPKSNVNFEYLTNCLAALRQDDIDNDPRLVRARSSSGGGGGGNNSRHDSIVEIDPLARDFIVSCLKIDPNERPSIQHLMNHPFIARHENTIDREDNEKNSKPQQSGSEERSNFMDAYDEQFSSYSQK